MQFLRRNQFLLCFLAVLVFASVMTIRQFKANDSAHDETREDFIFLVERGELQPAGHLYQVLIQELPELSEKTLVDDLQRLTMVADPKTPDPENLTFKYYVGVKKELDRRSVQRLSSALEQARKK